MLLRPDERKVEHYVYAVSSCTRNAMLTIAIRRDRHSDVDE